MYNCHVSCCYAAVNVRSPPSHHHRERWQISQGYQQNCTLFIPQEVGTLVGFGDHKWQFSKSPHIPIYAVNVCVCVCVGGGYRGFVTKL